MTAMQRRPLKKAPAPSEGVAAQIAAATPPEQIVVPDEPATPKTQEQTAASPIPAAAPVRRGPGRPRAKVRYEPLTTKIEIGLRDQLDQHVAETGQTIVEVIDEALRAYIRPSVRN